MTPTPSARLGLLAAGLSLIASAAGAAVFNVTTTTDELHGGCAEVCSLRDAVVAANAAGGTGVILLPAGTYTLTHTGAGDDSAALGDLDLTADVTILGHGAADTILDGNAADRVLDVLAGAQVEVRDVTIRNGAADLGGGVRNAGTLLLVRSIVQSNHATVEGGGVWSGGTNAALTVEHSTIASNVATLRGGGILVRRGDGSIEASTVALNQATDGGGLYYVGGTSGAIRSATVATNSASHSSGGIFAESLPFVSIDHPALVNTILAKNSAPSAADCSGPVVSNGYNLLGTGGDCIDFLAVKNDQTGSAASPLDPKLASLAGNGGPTTTLALLAGSPALDHGNPAAAGDPDACSPSDQRGAARPGAPGSLCDVGAFEQTTRCVAGGTSLCLNGGRFRVTAHWQTASAAGDAEGVALTPDTGYFWFFAPSNVEVTVKVLNGCSTNQRFWVFSSGLTNVRVDLAVTDTVTGKVKTYSSPQGPAYTPRLDTQAFAVCS